uniref:Plethodontid modulating factor n=1 Tax=Plethodon aureolus TaxID=263669 RepID=Q0GAU3_9SALA|nr:plethodontid modulating factor [Plethodon aureolus]
MRTTALLILLVVLVSTGEALQCNTLDGGTEECPSDDYVCVHYKYDVEFMGCRTQPFCDTVKDALAAFGSEGTIICCSEDVCN